MGLEAPAVPEACRHHYQYHGRDSDHVYRYQYRDQPLSYSHVPAAIIRTSWNG
jgi:hypothetical protein